MKKCYPFLCVLIMISTGYPRISFSQTMTFYYTGLPQTWTVPTGVTAIFADVQGAEGGEAGAYTALGLTIGPTTPGCGGRVQANLAVTPGQILNINVGGSGQLGLGYTTTPGGYNGGGSTSAWAPVAPDYSGGSGGGMTDISNSGTELIIAGGGGGAGYNGACALSGQPGGNGGGLVGDSAVTCYTTLRGLGFTTIIDAGGGSQTAGGAGAFVCCGGYYAGTAGGLGTGGNNVDSGGVGGGGGGGYYGGGGGCWMGGGGGSSYTNPAFTSNITHTQGHNCSNGIVVICILPYPGNITGTTTVCGSGNTTLVNGSASGGTWSSVNTAIATVDPTGVVYGVAGGTTTISYSVSNSCGTTATTTTVNIITAGTITGKDSVCQRHTDTLADLVTGGEWSSFNNTIATVGSLSGIVTGVSPGTDTIYYSVTISGCVVKSTFYLRVKSSASCISGVNDVTGNVSAIKVIPNPGHGVFLVTLSSDIDEEARFLATNMLGEKVSELNGVTNQPATLRLNVPPGVYFLSATTMHGNWTEKIMVIK